MRKEHTNSVHPLVTFYQSGTSVNGKVLHGMYRKNIFSSNYDMVSCCTEYRLYFYYVISD